MAAAPVTVQPAKRHWTAWLPTNKWWVATITAAGTVVGMIWLGNGIDTDEEKLVLIGLVVQRLATYWTRNDPNPPEA